MHARPLNERFAQLTASQVLKNTDSDSPNCRPEVSLDYSWRFPTPEQFTLANGLSVWLVHQPGQYLLDIRLMMRLPLDSEPADQEGVATLVANCADEGTKTHPKGRIGELIEDQGSSYRASVGANHTVVNMSVAANRLSKVLPYFVEILTEPDFDSSDVELHKELLINDLNHLKSQPGPLASVAVNKWLFADRCRRSRISQGSQQSIAGLDSEQVADFHRKHWSPKQAVLVVTGDLPPEVSELIAKVFSTWSGEIPNPVSPIETKTLTGEIVFVDRPESAQSIVRMVSVIPGRLSQYWPGLKIAVNAVGGAFNSRLNMVLREEKGFTYGAHLSAVPMSQQAFLSFSASFRNEISAEAILQTKQLLQIADKPLTSTEAAQGRKDLVLSAPLGYDCPSAIGSQLIALADAGLDYRYLNDYFDRLLEIDPKNATDLAYINQSYLNMVNPENMLTVIVGRAESVVDELCAAGMKVKVVEISALGI